MTDVVTIWNQALSASGSRGLVSSQEERGREADSCRLWFPTIRDAVLKSASWPCASKYTRLGVLAQRTTVPWDEAQPPPGWLFAYGAPSDMLAPRHLTSFGRFDRKLWQGQQVIVANEEQAILHYTMRQEDVSLWDHGLVTAVTYALAAALSRAPAAKPSVLAELLDRANEAVLLARAEFANESDDQMDSLPNWLAERGYSAPASSNKFFWPVEAVYLVPA